MTGRIVAIAIDCRDAESLAGFWCAALHYRIVKRWRDSHDVEYLEARRAGEPMLLFQPVPDTKRAKNRMHLHVRVTGSQYDEVARLMALGARLRADDPAEEWVVLEDPEGNEFCVLPPR